MKNLIQIYSVVVSIIAAIILMISIPFSLRSGWDILFINSNEGLLNYDNDEYYVEYKKEQCRKDYYYVEKASIAIQQCLDDINPQKRVRDKEKHIKFSLSQSRDTLLTASVWQFVCVLFLLFQWRLLKKYNSI